MYEKKIKLTDNEVPAKINKETGEIIEVRVRPNNLHNNKVVFEPKLMFSKSYEGSLTYIRDNLTPKEVVVVLGMIELATMNTNYIKPLHAESTVTEISEVLGVHRNHVKRIMENLYQHGIYSKSSVMTKNGEKHWLILNPYISFKGKTIDVAIIELFSDTRITDYVKSFKKIE